MYSDGYRVVRKRGLPTAGGAHAKFEVISTTPQGEVVHGVLEFQPDTIPKVGVIGWTNECLLAVIRERLQAFQDGPFPCAENEAALVLVDATLRVLERRTASRQARGVEGQHTA